MTRPYVWGQVGPGERSAAVERATASAREMTRAMRRAFDLCIPTPEERAEAERRAVQRRAAYEEHYLGGIVPFLRARIAESGDEAGRLRLDVLVSMVHGDPYEDGFHAEELVRIEALAFSGHPDYNPDWKPDTESG